MINFPHQGNKLFLYSMRNSTATTTTVAPTTTTTTTTATTLQLGLLLLQLYLNVWLMLRTQLLFETRPLVKHPT